MKRYLATGSILLLFSAAAWAATTIVPRGAPYPNTVGMGLKVSSGAEWYQQCVAVQKVEPPTQDLPPASAASSLRNCVASELYYDTKSQKGSGRTEWQAVRYCAFARGDQAVLMMVYANGFGVPKNPKLALKYACSVESAEQEMSGRVAHLVRRSDGSSDVFDQCDDITSGQMLGTCHAIAARQDDKARNRDLGNLIKQWSPAQQTALRELQKATEGFAMLRAQGEVDSGGTMAASFAIDAQRSEMTQMVRDLQTFEKGKTPSYSEAGFIQLDKKMNALFQKIMEQPGSDPANPGTIFGTVNKDGIKSTQRAWLAYRDAMTAVGLLRYPAVTPWSWKALLTERRIKQLSEFEAP